MPLFHTYSGRIGNRAKAYGEPVFDYYNRSARRDVAVIREILEGWFTRFPGSAQADVRQRFRPQIERQHQGAFFELYLHELLTRLEYRIEAHPEVDEPTHPDFLLRKEDRRFYLEATIAAESDEEVGQQRLVD